MRVRWMLGCALVLAMACGGEEASPAEPAAASAPSEAAPAAPSEPAPAAEGASGGTCEESATASDEACHACCVGRGAAGNAWMGGDNPSCRCIGG